MKKIIGLFFVLLLSFAAIYGCGTVISSNNAISSATGTITGVVTNSSGTVLSNVIVTGEGKTATTNSQGWFALTSLSPSAEAKVNFALSGYIATQKIITVEAGKSQHLNVSMVSQVTATTITVTDVATVTSGSATLVIPANAFEKSDGTAYSGTTASVSLTPTTFSTTFDADAFPGTFQGVATSGATTTFTSYGWIDAYATGGGETLRVKLGKSVTVTMPNQGGAAPAATTVPVWYYDFTSGQWKAVVNTDGSQVNATYSAANDEFTFTVPGGSAQADLSGLPWNVDAPVTEFAYVKGRVLDSNSNAVSGARIVITAQNNTWMQDFGPITGTDGRFGPIAVPANMALTAEAISGTSKSLGYAVSALSAATYTQVNPYDIGDMALNSSKLQFTLTWGENPVDLDSHLTIPATAGASSATRYHLYYGNMDTTSSISYPYSNLDTDDTTSYGPEHTTVYVLTPGKYRFCVHHFNGSSTIANSSAKVVLNTDDGRGNTNTYIFTPPSNQPTSSTVWEVCDITVTSNSITEVKTLANYGSPQSSVYNPDNGTDQIYTSLGVFPLSIEKKK